jgi:predicted ATPase
LLRVKGELLLLRGTQEAEAAAEDHFRQALDWARRQGALSFELRAATSLARLLRNQGRSAADATALLQPVYDRFTEGFDTADLKTAKALLDAPHIVGVVASAFGAKASSSTTPPMVGTLPKLGKTSTAAARPANP